MEQNNNDFVSIIIPCRNEKRFIKNCLDSVVGQGYPKEKMEVLVIDGMSDDGTKEIIEEFVKEHATIKRLENPQKYTPFALNRGVKEAKGDIIVRMDVHAGYEKDYVVKCVKYLKDYQADNVGGVLKTMPRESTFEAKAIAFALSHPFGAAGSRFRTGVNKPIEVDTVFCGCYPRNVFERIGLFNEKLIRSQDIEFNKRLKKAGGRILLVPEIIAYYFPETTLKDFIRKNLKDGFWAIYPLKFVKTLFSWRHYLPMMFVAWLSILVIASLFRHLFFIPFIITILIYLFVSLCFSFLVAMQEKEWRYLFLMPIAFGARHFAYGLGSLWGVIKLI